MKTALVHDWLTGMRGGEKVLEALCDIFPDAPIYTLFYQKNSVSSLIENKRVIKASFLNRMPYAQKKYRYYLPLMPTAISRFDLSEYDRIFSISHCVAKGIRKKRKNQIHICYCNTPMRYIWDYFGEYFSPGRNFFVWSAMSVVRPYLRWWDVKTSSTENVDYFIANSNNVASRIKKFWHRDSVVIYPPVDTNFYTPCNGKNTDSFASSFNDKDFYLIVSALVPYKKTDLAIKAFNKLGKKLKIIGTGPDEDYLKKIARENIEFLGWQDNNTIREHYRNCKGLVFPGEEDFGIVPVEAQACGRPVIAYGKGGALETVIDGKTGVFFYEQTEEVLIQAVETFETMEFDQQEILSNALRFSKNNFIQNLKSYLKEKGGYSYILNS